MKTTSTRKRLLFFLLAVLAAFQLYAQTQETTIKGKLTDEQSGEAIAGASVYIKGTKTAVQTDPDGLFEIKTNQAYPFVLAVNYVGYQLKELEIYEEDQAIELKLRPSNALSEVVVVGYGEQKRADVTGSISSVPVELKTQPVASLERLLQGAVPGAIVTQTSGQPGGGVSVQIRGANSISASSDPLYVIDGFPVNNDYSIGDAGVANGSKINPLSTINTADIESIDVLKDASATAIYGSRGANGVILITTKKAKNNESTVTYDGYYGVQNVIRTIPVMGAADWWQLRKDAAANTDANNGNSAGTAALNSSNLAIRNNAIANGYTIDTLGAGTDWQKAAFRQAPIQSHSLSILTGTDKTKVAFSGNYFSQDGVLINTDFKRYSARLNLDHEFNSRIKIGSFLNPSVTTSNIAPDAIVPNLILSPQIFPIYKNDGTFVLNTGGDNALQNPINSLYNQINQSNNTRFLGSVYGDAKIIEGLNFRVLVGIDYFNNKQNRYLPRSTQEGLGLQGQGIVGQASTLNWLNENTLSYSKIWKRIHSFNAVAGFTAQRNTTEGQISSSQNFANDYLTYNNLGTAVTPNSPSTSYSQWSLASWLGRINYVLLDKYLLTLTVRSDGSSRFGDNNKWGVFPSAALGWNLHKENFLKNVKPLSTLKIRTSIGLTGNQSIPPYSSLSIIDYYRYSFGGGQTQAGFAPRNIGNPNLGWEKTLQFDIGLEASFFKNRLGFSFDYYYKYTTDLLLAFPVSGASSGIAQGSNVDAGQRSTIFANIGKVKNEGVEVSVNSNNFIGKFKWNTLLIASYNRNEILDLGPGVNRIIINQNAPSVLQVGQPIGSFLVYQTDGLVQPNEAGPNALTPQAFKGAGAQKYKDVDGDGKITQTGDRVVIANNPAWNLGLTNTFSYETKFGTVDLTAFVQGSFGGKLYNQNQAQLELNNGGNNASAVSLNRYTSTNTNTDVKAAFRDPAIQVSDRFIEDASYIRLKNISLGYTFPTAWTSKIKIKTIRIYVSAQNYFTWTKYTGFDPEVSQSGQNLLNRGVDYGVYPNSKTILGGLTLTF